MSIRQFRPRGDRRRGISTNQTLILYGGFALSVFLQILYPLVHGQILLFITIATVYAGAAVMLVHAWLSYGARYAITFVILTFGISLGIELLGSKTGWPFGRYAYDASLGIQIDGVPLIVPFAWIMMAHPILVAARKVTQHWVFLFGGFGLMAWDLFLDPQMVAAHRWTWKVVGPHVPFQPEIPLSNAAGWLFAGMGLMAILHIALPKEHRKRGANTTLIDLALIWTWFSGVVGNLFFFHRTGVALFGGFVFAFVLIPYLFQARFGRPDDL